MDRWRKAEEFWRALFVAANGRRQPGSGNQPGLPGDVRFLEHVLFQFNHPALLESKQRRCSVTLSDKLLDKISLEAAQLGRMPLVGITIGSRQWLLVPAHALTIGGGDSPHEAAQLDRGGGYGGAYD